MVKKEMKVFTYASLATHLTLVGRKKIIIIKKVILWAFTLISIIHSHKHSVWAPCRVQSHASCALLGIFLLLVTSTCPQTHSSTLCACNKAETDLSVFSSKTKSVSSCCSHATFYESRQRGSKTASLSSLLNSIAFWQSEWELTCFF